MAFDSNSGELFTTDDFDKGSTPDLPESNDNNVSANQPWHDRREDSTIMHSCILSLLQNVVWIILLHLISLKILCYVTFLTSLYWWLWSKQTVDLSVTLNEIWQLIALIILVGGDDQDTIKKNWSNNELHTTLFKSNETWPISTCSEIYLHKK